ncbi:MAG: ABC transporter ATP-binding protein [Parvularculaceae bacterium]|nr:ABC transporter ATP-binding protein [Parvularculaceae bacterium]
MTEIVASAVTVERDKSRALDSVSARFSSGECVAILGPNGAGKSTLLRALAGLERPASGSVTIDGVDVDALAPSTRARRLAYLSQARPLFAAIDVEAVVALGRFAWGAPMRLDAGGRDAVARASAETDVAQFSARTATTLSGGELARVHLARMLAGETPALLADEPVAALDPKHQWAILSLLRRRADEGATVVLVLHDLALARRFATRLLVLKQGRVFADGAPADVGDALVDAFDLDAEAAAHFAPR